ncbi:MAG: DUF4373 domain-containing protein [Flavihumibacter sp.]|nr:DUF4373 domain-containing protein [Flavihumibacter sp.]
MGRHIKEGLSYFPLDVDFFEDEKVQFISARFGIKGDGILARLLCRIYRQGYGLSWDDDVALLFARAVGEPNALGLVKEVVGECLKRGFFDEALFKRFGLLSSKGIQKRYSKICLDSKRKNWEIPPKFDLLRSEGGFTPEEIEKTPEESTQSKVKKSKVKKSSGGDESPDHPPEVNEKFKAFQEWLATNAVNVTKMKEPFTIDQFIKLKEKYSSKVLSDLCQKMHNWKPLLQKNTSAYLTLTNWSKKEFNQLENEPAKTTIDVREEKDRLIRESV